MKSLITAVSVIAMAAASATPDFASAQDYGGYPPAPAPPQETCQHDQTGNTVIGAVIGAGLGALLGAALAAEGHGGDGAALGAGLGGIGGGVIGSSSSKCSDDTPPPPPRPYGDNGYSPSYAQSAPPPGYQDRRYGAPPSNDEREQGYDTPPTRPGGYDNGQAYSDVPPPPSGQDEFDEPAPGSYAPPQ